MACATHLLPLFLLIQLLSLAASNSHGIGNATAASFCHPDQASALLGLKQSFIFDYSTTTLPSWQPGTDCCLWEGVGCDDGASGGGRVTVLDLGGRGLYSYGCHVTLFNLTSLRYLDLSLNDFGKSHIPAAGFQMLSKLTHLNLSNSGFYGQIPIAIGQLTSLILLDLSHQAMISKGEYNNLLLREPSFMTVVANLTNLRELYLDGVDISDSGEGWCSGLGEAVPSLEVLSMSYCHLHGPIHSSMSSLRSLTVVNFNLNAISGVIPEFFADFLNLSVLKLSYNHFSGWFPPMIFQLKNIRVLDVSSNGELSGHLQEFPNDTSLETLNLQYTAFSGIQLSSFSNLLSLRELGFDGRSISMGPTDLLYHKLDSLQNLQLSPVGFLGDLGAFFSWIISLKSLTSLQLSYCYSSKIMLALVGNLTNLTSLDISSCDLPQSFGNLNKLTSLRISDCVLSKMIASSIGNLKELRSLEISYSDFSGTMPSSIGNLKKLRSLKISHSNFSGTVPSSIGNLKKLRSLEISHSGLSGQIPAPIGYLRRLKILVLAGCMLHGRIPSLIANLTQLTYLDLSQNVLQGEIPRSLFTSPELLGLDLSSNQLSGSIQEFDASNSHISSISLSENQISGQVPASFFQLKSLVVLDLSSNNLTGLVMMSLLPKLLKLGFLNLSYNKLSVLDGEGSKPVVPILPKLQNLRLVSCNMKTIPRFLMHVNHISILDLSDNKIHGTIPQWIWETWDDSLTQLNLSNNILTHMQLTSYVLSFSYLHTLDLSSNSLPGQIPMLILLKGVETYYQFLDYSNNRFSSLMSNFTAYLSQIAHLKLSRNNLSGEIPHSICDSSNLEVLDLSYNNFSGLIPSCLIEGSRLAILNLRENYFEGTLPHNVSEHCNLQTMDLHGNKFQGPMPRSLLNCSYLQVLDIGNNQIVDTFPSWLSRLSNLHVLVLRSNQFYGPLTYPLRDSKIGGYFSKLQIIDIASNKFSGKLDPQWFESLTYMIAKSNDTGYILRHPLTYSTSYYQDTVAIAYKGQYVTFGKILSGLTAIDLSNNALDGDIPESVGRLVSLHILNMSHNTLNGRIPSQIGEMRELESLDLSWNELSGEIPEELTDLSFLGTLNLCGNKLDGRIPQSHQFATFENTSYEGSAGLCGPPLSKPCANLSNPNEAQVNKSKDRVDVILFLFVGVGFGVGFTAGILLKWCKIGKWFRIV